MDSRIMGVWIGVGLGAAALSAANVQGTVVIERKLTKRNVTAAAGLYQRGSAVNLSADAGTDPLDYERSHVIVYLEDEPGLSRSPVKDHSTDRVKEPEMEQQDRRFVPDLLVVAAGESVSFPNFDPIFHNVFSLSKAKSFDLGNYPKGQTRRITFPSPGIVSVYCHLHPNMTASILVTPNQWSTVADARGNFVLRDVPPGTHTVVAWHKAAGFFRQTIEVTAEHGAHAQFMIPLRAATGEHDARTDHTESCLDSGSTPVRGQGTNGPASSGADGSGHDCAPATASLRSR
jgi:plastocyanin